MSLDRRNFLKGLGGLGIAGGAAAITAGTLTSSGAAAATDIPTDPRLPAVPFHGVHQAGILTPAPPAAIFAVCDLTTNDRREVVELHAVDHHGRPADDGGRRAARPRSRRATDRQRSARDGRSCGRAHGDRRRRGVGLRRPIRAWPPHKPKRLTPMRTFPNDNLDPTQTHGDLVLQICAGHRDTTLRALRLISKHTRGGMQLRYRVDGFISPPAPSGTPRNQLGFKDGIANPPVTADTALADRLVWAASRRARLGGRRQLPRAADHPDVRRVLGPRLAQRAGEDDRPAPRLGRSTRRQRRDRHTGICARTRTAPSSRSTPTSGLSNPRTPATDDSRILRRGYNYDRGDDSNGNLDVGLVFNCFQQDPVRQFEATQRRLIDEPLVDYISPTGGGYFFTLPGVRDVHDWYGRTLFA